MRWPMVAIVVIGCGTSPAPTPIPPAKPTVVALPVDAAAPIDSVVAAVAPASPCELDPESAECLCQQGNDSACIRVADLEFTNGQRDIAFVRVRGLCEREVADACFAAAKYLRRMHAERKHKISVVELGRKGMAIHEAKCAAGNHHACFAFAKLLVRGSYWPADKPRARTIIETSCTAKHLRSCVMLGNIYLVGDGVRKDIARAKQLFDSACTADASAGCAALGDLVAKTDKVRALELYERACGADDPEGCARSGEAAQKAGDVPRATERLAKACELERTASCVAAGTLLAADPPRARAAFERACDVDIGEACALLAPYVAEGKGGPRSWGDALDLAEKACTLKAPRACDQHAQLRRSPPVVTCKSLDECNSLCDGEGLPSACVAVAKLDMANGCDETVELSLEKACKGGDPAACVMRGNVVSGHVADAKRWYYLGCKDKHEPACVLDDAAALRDGFEPPDRDKGARTAITRRCKAGNQLACLGLGVDLLHGDKQKVKEGERVLEAACNAGQGHACRLFAQTIDTTLFGMYDEPITPAQQTIINRKVAVFEQGCKAGDTESCASALGMRGKDESTAPKERCGEEIRWIPRAPQAMGY